MKPIKTKFKQLDEIENNIGSSGSSSSNYTNLRRNKRSFYQTKSTNFSLEQNKNQYNTPERKHQKKPELISLRKNGSIKLGLKKPIISISTPDNRENKKIKLKGSPIKINSLMPTNINGFQHLISGRDYGIFENVNWVLGLRDLGPKYKKNNESSKEKINLTTNFNEPSFYVEDLEKYKKKKKNGEEKIIKFNPNYNKIKHLILAKNSGYKNYSQFNFSTRLRDYNKDDNKNNKDNKEKEKKWIITPLPKIKSDNYVVKCLSPITHNGIQNVKKLEKIMPKNYEINHGEAIVGNDRIKTKILVNNRSYTVCGYGEYLGDPKYNNKFGDNNMFANKDILKTETNPSSKFELGLRIYGSYKNINHFNKMNNRKKSK